MENQQIKTTLQLPAVRYTRNGKWDDEKRIVPCSLAASILHLGMFFPQFEYLEDDIHSIPI